MKAKSPRYKVQRGTSGWLVIDTHGVTDPQLPSTEWATVAVLQSEACARSACESLNRGLCETVAKDGRWSS